MRWGSCVDRKIMQMNSSQKTERSTVLIDEGNHLPRFAALGRQNWQFCHGHMMRLFCHFFSFRPSVFFTPSNQGATTVIRQFLIQELSGQCLEGIDCARCASSGPASEVRVANRYCHGPPLPSPSYHDFSPSFSPLALHQFRRSDQQHLLVLLSQFEEKPTERFRDLAAKIP